MAATNISRYKTHLDKTTHCTTIRIINSHAIVCPAAEDGPK